MKINRIIATALIVVLTLFVAASGALAADDIEFTAELSAEDTWIPPDGIIDFTVGIENTGAVDIDRFEIITPDAILVAEYGELPAGKSASVAVHSIDFHNPGEYPVELFVVGYSGDDSLTRHTNELTITVSNDSEPTPTAEPAATPTAAPEPTPEPTVEPAAEPSVELSAGADASDTATDDSSRLYIIIAGLGVLAGAGVVTVIVIARKGKKTD